MPQPNQNVDLWLAKQQVAELQQLYAAATDLIGSGEHAKVAEGRAIYHRIFTPSAQIAAAGVDPKIGPDAWVELVGGALAKYQDTQHLIGTQRVEVTALPDATGAGGHAVLSSYLQGWHAEADGTMWLFIGTYESEATYSADAGWQLAKMMLVKTSEDLRQITGREA